MATQACMRLPMYGMTDSINVLSYTVIEIWRIIGPIFAVNRGRLSLTQLFGANPYIRDCKIRSRETRNSFIVWWSVFRHVEQFRRDSRVQQTERQEDNWTDGRTDRRTDNKCRASLRCICKNVASCYTPIIHVTHCWLQPSAPMSFGTFLLIQPYSDPRTQHSKLPLVYRQKLWPLHNYQLL